MKKIFFISVLLMTGKVLGQGIGSELYQYNYGFVHPAFAGSEGQRISMLVRTATYDGSFSDHAETMLLMSYENHFEKINSGIAVTGYSERLGPSSLSSLSLSYNYKLTLGASSELIASTRVRRHFYSVSGDYYRQIEPNDPLVNLDVSASNWAADLGVLFRRGESYVGLVSNDLLHTDNTLEVIGLPIRRERNLTALIGTSFTISEHLVSEHSLYIPFDREEYRVDLNNTLTINDLFLAGISLERSHDKFFVRGNAGLKVKDYFQVQLLIYSGKRDYFDLPKFRGEMFMAFMF